MQKWFDIVNYAPSTQTKRGAKPESFAPAQCPGGALGGAPWEGLGEHLGGDAEDWGYGDRDDQSGGENESGGDQKGRAGGGHWLGSWAKALSMTKL